MSLPYHLHFLHFLSILCLFQLSLTESDKPSPNDAKRISDISAHVDSFPKYPWFGVIANGGAFWLLKETTTKPPGFRAQMLVEANPGVLSLYSAQPGGQRVYVAPNGALRYILNNTAPYPPASSFGPFHYNLTFSPVPYPDSYSFYGPVTYVGPGSKPSGSGFRFCPTKEPPAGIPGIFDQEPPIQIFVDMKCLSDNDVPLGSVKACKEYRVTGRFVRVEEKPTWVYN
ncbi:MAG: hypothetical protein Q9205_003404 [Flavoplaca limonia]